MQKDYRLIVGWFFFAMGMMIEFILFIINPNQSMFESLLAHPILSGIAFFFCFYGLLLCTRCIISIRKELKKDNDKKLKTEDKTKSSED